MTDLITRLEEAAEGSRELDAAIARQFGWVYERRIPEFRSPKWWPPMELETKDQTSAYAYAKANPPPVTTSLDAALALAKRVLPRWRPMLRKHAGYSRAHLAAPNLKYEDDCTGRATTPALALCLAILRANHKDKP